jgi:hypothetical protein
MLDGRGFVYEHLADRQALDVHRQDLPANSAASSAFLATFMPPALPRPPDQYLRFNNNAATQFLGDVFRLFCGSRHPSLWDGNSILCKNVF